MPTFAAPLVQEQLANLIMVAWLLLIPVGLLLALLLYKLVQLLAAGLEFLTIARYDIYPMVKDLRATAAHVEGVTGRVAKSMASAEQALHAAMPKVKEGGCHVKQQGVRLMEAGQVFFNGVRRAFTR